MATRHAVPFAERSPCSGWRPAWQCRIGLCNRPGAGDGCGLCCACRGGCLINNGMPLDYLTLRHEVYRIEDTGPLDGHEEK